MSFKHSLNHLHYPTYLLHCQILAIFSNKKWGQNTKSGYNKVTLLATPRFHFTINYFISMNYKNQITLLRRSKSLCSLNECGDCERAGFADYRRYSRSVSESWKLAGQDMESHNDGISEEIGVLEKKIDKLSGIYTFTFTVI